MLFQEALQFRATIVLCYSQQIVVKVTGHVPPPLNWHIFQIIVDVLSSIVSACVLNRSRGHWLLFDALNVIITMSLKLKEEYKISLNLLDLIDDDSIVAQELWLLASNIKREVCGVLDGFLSFSKMCEENKTHNMLSLMLNLRFKSLRLVSFLIGQKRAISIVEEYDQRSLFPMLLRCYHILHLMAEFGFVVNIQTDEKNNLDGMSELSKEVVNKELLMFRRFQVDVKDIKCLLEWWVKHVFLFSIVAFFVH